MKHQAADSKRIEGDSANAVPFGKRLTSLDGLRGIAILAVIAEHTLRLFHPTSVLSRLWAAFQESSWAGVDPPAKLRELRSVHRFSQLPALIRYPPDLQSWPDFRPFISTRNGCGSQPDWRARHRHPYGRGAFLARRPYHRGHQSRRYPPARESRIASG